MLKIQCFLFCLMTYIVLGSKSHSYPFITPCSPNDKQCVLANTQVAIQLLSTGLPHLGFDGTDPIFIPSVRADSPNLKMGFQNIHIHSLAGTRVVDVVHDRQNRLIKLVLNAPFQATGQYDLDAKLSFIKAVGDGDFELQADKTSVAIILKYDVITKNGVQYWNIVGYDYSFDMVEKPYIRLDNLFGGDHKRAKPFLDIIKNSSNDVIHEIGTPIFEEVVAIKVKSLKKLFLQVPASQLETALQYRFYV